MPQTLEAPKIMVGVPIGDCNVHTPAAAGVPSPPWSIGALVAGHVYGLTDYHPGVTSSVLRANPYGTGRSLNVALQADMAGVGTAYLCTPQTPFGYVPNMGVTGATWRPSAVFIARPSFGLNQKVRVSLQHFRADGTQIGNLDMGYITAFSNETNPGDFVPIVVTPAADLAINTETRSFRFELYFYADGASTGSITFDFIGLGFTPRLSAPEAATDNYIGRSFRHVWDGGAEVTRTALGGAYTMNTTRGRRLVQQLSMEWLRSPLSWRDRLAYFWSVQNGGPSVADNYPSGVAGDLRGLPWPLLLLPGRPGMKQAMYARMTSPPLDVDESAGYVENPAVFSGVTSFEEQDY